MGENVLQGKYKYISLWNYEIWQEYCYVENYAKETHIIIITIIIIILYYNKWIGKGFTKSHIINYMDYLHHKKSNKSTDWKIFNKYANSVIKLNCKM